MRPQTSAPGSTSGVSTELSHQATWRLPFRDHVVWVALGATRLSRALCSPPEGSWDLRTISRAVDPAHVAGMKQPGTFSPPNEKLIARAVQEASASKHAPFVKLGCGAIPVALLESELGGHGSGAATSPAVRDAMGTQRGGRQSLRAFALALAAAGSCACSAASNVPQRTADREPAASAEPYPDMPTIAPIGVKISTYAEVQGAAQGPAIDPAKGYRLQELGRGLYMITNNAYQSMFLVYGSGVVVVDAPPDYSAKIPRAVAEVTDQPITHVIYSHSHVDHIAGTAGLGGSPIIIAHEETLRLLRRAADPRRPLPSVTFSDRYTLRVGDQILELSYHGNAHEPGNIFILAPAQRTLMVVDVIFPGWMPWRRFALAQDLPGYFEQVEEIGRLDWDTLVGGHVARTGTQADVALQAEFNRDVKAAAASALATTQPGLGLDPADTDNPWAGFDNYIDRVAARCVSTLTSKWSPKLAAFDAFIWDQCYAMEQSLRIE
jgi:glyoxylase-like metal-dependent hydrolase (beta-lactamase superfamily II)